MVKIAGMFVVPQELMQSILLYLQEKPYKEVAPLIDAILALNEQKKEVENKPELKKVKSKEK